MAADVSIELRPEWRRADWPPGDTPETRQALARIGGSIVRTAKKLAPVDTGSLQSTIRHTVTADTKGVHVLIQAGGMMGSTQFVDYAAHVEQGTSRMAAQPYLRPAVQQAVGLGMFR